MKLTTPVNIQSNSSRISSESRILTLGSCFSDNIGKRLSIDRFQSMVNPFGTVFNPYSIAKVLDRTIEKSVVTKEQINNHQDRYFHYDYHSKFDGVSPSQVIDTINKSISSTSAFLKQTDFLILTFGTSIIYRRKIEKDIVSNCHKVPSTQFSREIMEVPFMHSGMERIIEKLKTIIPGIKIILTVSPVRHTKEGLQDNSRSKGRLIDLCHTLTAIQNVYYFPAYEIMIDELRDYRFYKSDLIHPSDMAVDIVWERFRDVFFDNSAHQKTKDFQTIIQAFNHRPFNPLSSAHKEFCKAQLSKIQSLHQRYPEVNFQIFKDHWSIRD